MQWSTPDFVEITLCMEVTAYVNTDDTVEESS
jgi:coenzyme PQQ precursor peptide PqqA